MHRGQHIFLVYINTEARDYSHFFSFAEPRGTWSLTPCLTAGSLWLKFVRERKKNKTNQAAWLQGGTRGRGEHQGGRTRLYPHPPAGSLRRWDTHGLGQGQELSPIYWGGWGRPMPRVGSEEMERYVSRHTHILRLPDTAVTKKNKLLLRSSAATTKYNVDDRDNELPLDYMVKPKKVTP